MPNFPNLSPSCPAWTTGIPLCHFERRHRRSREICPPSGTHLMCTRKSRSQTIIMHTSTEKASSWTDSARSVHENTPYNAVSLYTRDAYIARIYVADGMIAPPPAPAKLSLHFPTPAKLPHIDTRLVALPGLPPCATGRNRPLAHRNHRHNAQNGPSRAPVWRSAPQISPLAPARSK